MPFTRGYDYAEAILAMTLCSRSYSADWALPNETSAAHSARMRHVIDGEVGKDGYPNWQIVWGPGLNAGGDNMLFVAKDVAAENYAVVIRGTDWNFVLDWMEDLNNLGLVPFPYVLDQAPDVQVAMGMDMGLQQLLGIVGTAEQGLLGLWDYLRRLPDEAQLLVTGHSLGGCLGTLLATWLAWRFGSAQRLKVYTFAAPSPGNAAFAGYYNQLFRDATGQVSSAFRVYNSLDLVPNAWATLPTIETYYADPGPHCTDALRAVLDGVQLWFQGKYVQTGIPADQSALELSGAVAQPNFLTAAIDVVTDARFAWEVQYQHGSDTYLRLLGAQIPVGAPAPVPSHPLEAKLLALAARVASAAHLAR